MMATDRFPQGSDDERHAMETEQIAQVFGLTGGEMADTVWNDGHGTLSHWWYEGVPYYAEEDHDGAEWEYRTQVRDIMFGIPEVHGWELVATYRSSGETECWHEGEPDESCPLCEGSGYIYIGDGWAELVYRRPFESVWREGTGRPCRKCAAVGRFTWLDDDGTCRRSDTH